MLQRHVLFSNFSDWGLGARYLGKLQLDVQMLPNSGFGQCFVATQQAVCLSPYAECSTHVVLRFSYAGTAYIILSVCAYVASLRNRLTTIQVANPVRLLVLQVQVQ